MQPGDGRDQHPGAGQHEIAERGRKNTAAVSDEQRAAENAFDALQLCGERGLGKAERGGGFGDAAGLGDGEHDS